VAAEAKAWADVAAITDCTNRASRERGALEEKLRQSAANELAEFDNALSDYWHALRSRPIRYQDRQSAGPQGSNRL
jgi:hypothetical protein